MKTIGEYRARYPQLRELTDYQLTRAVYDTTAPNMPLEAFAKAFGGMTEEDPEELRIQEYNLSHPDEPIRREDMGKASVLSDTGHGIAAGINDFAAIPFWLAEKAGIESAGKAKDYFLKRAKEKRRGYSPEMKLAQDEEFFTEGPDGSYGLGGAWTSPRKIWGSVAESMPSMVGGMGLSALAARGLMKAGLSRGLAWAVGSSLGEGAVGGAQNALDVHETILSMPDDKLAASPEYQELLQRTGDPRRAREKLADSVAMMTGLKTGASTAALAAPSGYMFGKLLGGETGKTLLGTVGKQGMTEFGEESGQSAAEQYLSQTELQRADPTIDPTSGIGEAAVSGGFAGFAMGGGMGGVGHVLGGRAQPQPGTHGNTSDTQSPLSPEQQGALPLGEQSTPLELGPGQNIVMGTDRAYEDPIATPPPASPLRKGMEAILGGPLGLSAAPAAPDFAVTPGGRAVSANGIVQPDAFGPIAAGMRSDMPPLLADQVYDVDYSVVPDAPKALSEAPRGLPLGQDKSPVAPESPQPVAVQTDGESTPLQLTHINDKSFMLHGDTGPFEEAIKAAGGRLDRKVGGWRFPLAREGEIRELFSIPLGTETVPGNNLVSEASEASPDVLRETPLPVSGDMAMSGQTGLEVTHGGLQQGTTGTGTGELLSEPVRIDTTGNPGELDAVTGRPGDFPMGDRGSRPDMDTAVPGAGGTEAGLGAVVQRAAGPVEIPAEGVDASLLSPDRRNVPDGGAGRYAERGRAGRGFEGHGQMGRDVPGGSERAERAALEGNGTQGVEQKLLRAIERQNGELTPEAEAWARSLPPERQEAAWQQLTLDAFKGYTASNLRVDEASLKFIPLRKDTDISLRLKALANLFGQDLIIFRDASERPTGVLGATVPTINDVIFMEENREGYRPHLSVLGHEMLHSLRNGAPKLYNDFKKYLLSELKPDALQGYREDMDRRTGHDGTVGRMSDDKILEEIGADLVGKRLTEESFWAKMAEERPSLFARVAQFVRDLLDRVTAAFRADPLPIAWVKDFDAIRGHIDAMMGQWAEKNARAKTGGTPPHSGNTREVLDGRDETVRNAGRNGGEGSHFEDGLLQGERGGDGEPAHLVGDGGRGGDGGRAAQPAPEGREGERPRQPVAVKIPNRADEPAHYELLEADEVWESRTARKQDASPAQMSDVYQEGGIEDLLPGKIFLNYHGKRTSPVPVGKKNISSWLRKEAEKAVATDSEMLAAIRNGNKNGDGFYMGIIAGEHLQEDFRETFELPEMQTPLASLSRWPKRGPDNTPVQLVEVEPGIVPEFQKARDLAKWLKEYFADKREETILSTGKKIRFGNGNLEASIKRVREAAHNQAYAGLNELVRRAEYDSFEAKDARHPNLGGQEVYYSALRIGDSLYAVKFKMDVPSELELQTRRERRGEKNIEDLRYKDHALREIEIAPVLYRGVGPNTGGPTQATGAIREISLGVLRDAVKPSRLENGVLSSVKPGEFLNEAPSSARRVHKAAVQSVADALGKRAANAADTRVVQSFEELPKAVRDVYGHVASQVEGVYDTETDTVYLVADNLRNPARAAEVWMHENMVHHGLNGLLEKGEKRRLLNRLWQGMGGMGNADIAAIARRYGVDPRSDTDGRALVMEEYLASLAEKRAADKLSGQDKTYWRCFVDAVLRVWHALVDAVAGRTGSMKYENADRLLSALDRYVFEGRPEGMAESGAIPAMASVDKPGMDREAAHAAWEQLRKDTEAWRKQLEEFVSGNNMRVLLTVSHTPDVLQRLGAKELPLTITGDNLGKIMSDKEDHGIPAELLRKLPEALAEPVMVFESATRSDSFVVLTELKHEGRSVMVAVAMDKEKQNIRVNDIASAYKRKSESWYAKQIEEGRLLYQDKKKSLAWARTNRLQLPKVRKLPSRLSGKRILTEEDVVKPIAPFQGTNPMASKRGDPNEARFSPDTGKKTDFVTLPDGRVDFAQFPQTRLKDMRLLRGAPIRLQRGRHNPAGGNFGLLHIEAGHGEDIRNAGYENVQEFVWDLVNDFDQIWQGEGKSVLLVRKDKERGKAAGFISLEKTGEFYSVNTAFPADAGYPQQKTRKLLWSRDQHATPATGEQAPFNPFRAFRNPIQSQTGNLQGQRGQSNENIQQGRTEGNPLASLRDREDGDAAPTTPLDSFRSKIGGHRPTVAERFAAFRENWKRKVEQQIFDHFASIKDVSKDGYVQARMTSSLGTQIESLIKYGAPVWNDGIMGVQGKSLTDVFAPVASEMDSFMGWMVANRAARLKKEGRENLFTDAEIAAARKLNEGVMPDGSRRADAYKKVFEDFARFKKAVLDFAQEGGIIDPESRSAWENADYIPFYRVKDGLDTVRAARNNSGFAGQASGIRTLKGGKANIGDPVENIMQNFIHLIDAAQKNRAADMILQDMAKARLARKLAPEEVARLEKRQGDELAEVLAQDKELAAQCGPLTDRQRKVIAATFSPTEFNYVRVQKDGKSLYYSVEDPMLLDALTGMWKQDGRKGPVWNLLRGARRFLTAGVTTMPDFMLRNFLRDTLHTWTIEHQSGYRPLVDSLAQIRNTFNVDEDTKQLLAAGSAFMGSGYRLGNSGEEAAKALNKVLGKYGMDKKAFLDSVLDSEGKLKSFIGKLWDTYEHAGSAAENAARLAVYKKMRAKGFSHREAAFAAKDMMDFTVRGQSQLIQSLCETVPFLGARLAGLHRLGRGAVENPRAFAVKGMTIALASMALYALNQALNPDDWDKMEDWEKDTYFHFWVDGEHFRLPKPFEVGFVFGTIPERLMEQLITDKSGGVFASRVFAGIWDQLAFNPFPQAVRPLVEQVANKDFFRGTPIVGMGMDRKAPVDQFDSRTSLTARAMASFMDALLTPVMGKTGADVLRSPKRLEHLVNGYFGGLGAFALGASDMLLRPLGNEPEAPELKLEELPIIRSFYSGSGEKRTRYESELYEVMKQGNKLHASLKQIAEEGGDVSAAKAELSHDDIVALANRKGLTALTKEFGKLNKAAEKVRINRVMSSSDKRKELDNIQRRKNILAQRAMKRIEEMRVQ